VGIATCEHIQTNMGIATYEHMY